MVVQFTSFWVCEANGKAGEGIVLCFAWLDNLVCRLCFSVFVLMQSCVFLSFGYQFAGYGGFGQGSGLRCLMLGSFCISFLYIVCGGRSWYVLYIFLSPPILSIPELFYWPLSIGFLAPNIQNFGLLFDPSLLDSFTRFLGIFPFLVTVYAV